MSNDIPSQSDDVTVHAAEIWISNILRVGVWVSFAIVFVGMTVTFVRHPDYHRSVDDLHRLTNPGTATPTHLGEVINGLEQGRGRAIIELGLLTLIATPVVRVATSVIAFAAMRDRKFVLITLIVLTLLLISFWLGKVEA